MGKPCPCVSRRKGALMAGIFYLVLGNVQTITLTLLFTLHSSDILWDALEDDNVQRKQSLGRILIFYIPPAFLTVTLGVLLTLTAHYNDSRLAEVTFIMSTSYVCGAGIEVIAMKLYGAPWLTISPMVVIFVVQMYNFTITADYRDYILNHGHRVKTSAERHRLHEDADADPDAKVKLNEENGNESDSASVKMPDVTSGKNNFNVSFKFNNENRKE